MSGLGNKLLAFTLLALSFLLPTHSYAQVVNGNFSSGATGWTSSAPLNSTLVFSGGQLTATSNDNSTGQVTTLATQTFTAADPGFLSYLLVSYSSTDVADWDWPLFRVNATNFRISTTGTLIASGPGAVGAVTNGPGATNLPGFTTLPAGVHTVGPGVFSQDSAFGPGIAVWDNIDFQEITISPSTQSTPENLPLTLSGANAPQTATNSTATVTVTLSVSNGILNLGSPGAVIITGGADGTATVTFTGTPAQINTAMNGLGYSPTLGFEGAETLVYTAVGSGLTDTDNITINVIPGNPSISITKTASAPGFTTGNVQEAPVGTVITYTYVVENNGDQPISNIDLVDNVVSGSGTVPDPRNEVQLPGNDVSPFGDSTDSVADDGIWDNLAPGDFVTFTGSYTVTQSDVDTLQ